MKLFFENRLNEDSLDRCREDAHSISKYIDKNGSNIWYDLVDYDMVTKDVSKVVFEVSGDWKHEHLFFKSLLNDWANEHNKKIVNINEAEIGDSGSDDYTAQYVISIADNDPELLQDLKQNPWKLY